MKNKRLKIVAGILIFFFFIQANFSFAPVAKAAIFGGGIPDRYDIVAVVVDEEIYNDSEEYEGLRDEVRGGGLPKTTLSGRINRYTADIQNKLENTRAVIVPVSRQEKTGNIAHVLERLYFEGDPENSRKETKLVGAVFVGNVPLPVVNKNGTRFLSMFPYIDFEKKAYVWNSDTQDFERDNSVSEPKVEIWHGVIRSPRTEDDEESRNLLAKFFDKNHLYHSGNPLYSRFGENVFYADLFFEKKGINPFQINNYLKLLEHLEDKAYYRNTRELLESLRRQFEGEAEEGEDALSPAEQRTLDSERRRAAEEARDNARALGFDVPDDDIPLEPEESIMPDILTKPLISKYLSEYKDIFPKFAALMNDFAEYTGRYSPSENLDTMVNLMTAKDKYTMLYLREVNDRMEAEIDRYIEDELASPIPIIDTTAISLADVSIKKPDGSGVSRIENGEDGFSFPETVFSNHSLSHHLEVAEDHDVLGNHIRTPEYQGGVWGNSVENLQNVSQCSLYRGSLAEGEEIITKLVKLGRQYFLRTVERNMTPLEKETLPAESAEEARREFRVNPYAVHGGCYYPTLGCFPEAALSPIALIEGTNQEPAVPVGSDDYRSCYLLHEKTKYQEFYQFAAEFLQEMSRKSNEDQRAAVASRIGEIPERNRDPSGVPLFVATDAGLAAHDIRGIPRDALRLNLRDVLSQIPGLDPDDPFSVSSALFANTLQNTLTVPFVSNRYFENVTLKHDSNILKQIPSIFYHKEPTAQTLSAQAKGLVSQSLPIDNPRYVTFQDREGNLRRVDYPNIFRARTFEDVREMLGAKEQELSQIAGNDDFEGELISIFEDDAEFSENHVKDSVEWKSMNLSQRHRYLLTTYLNPEKNAYVGERVNGYELFVLNGEGRADAMDIDFAPGENKKSPLFTEMEQAQRTVEERVSALRNDEEDFEEEDAGERGGSGCNVTGLRAGLPLFDLTDFPRVCSPWLIGIQKWMGSLVPSTKTREAENDDEFYAQLDAKQEADKKALKEEQKHLDDQAYLEPSDWETFTRAFSIELVSPLPILQKNVEGDVTVDIVVKDLEGNILKDEFVPLDLSVTGAGVIFADQMDDNNPSEPGFQTASISGSAKVRLKATDQLGEATFTAKILGTEIMAELAITVVEEARLTMETNDLAVQADDRRIITMQVHVEDPGGNILPQANGIALIKISDDTFGELLDPVVTLVHGEGSFRFKVGKKSGKILFYAAGGSMQPANLEMELLPGPPNFLRLSKVGESRVKAEVFDAFGNFVSTDSHTQVTFSLDESSHSLTRLSEESPITVTNGVAETNVLFDQQGTIFLMAIAEGLTGAVLEMTPKTELLAQDIVDANPQALAVALLGIPGGDVTKENALGNNFVFSGKTQAVASLTAPSSMQKTLLEINNHGGIKITDESQITANVILQDTSRIQFLHTRTQEIVGEMEVNPQENRGVQAITDEPLDALEDGIYVKEIDPEITFRSSSPEKISLIRQNLEIGSIGNDGKITLLDPTFSVSLKESPYLTFEISRQSRPISQIIFIQHFGDGISMDGEERSTLANVHFEPFLAGNSTADLTGLALVSEEETVSGNNAPGFSYRSLEDSLSESGVGFTRDNKFALLFAGGSSFGEANMPYASDIGIVLGDPTVHIDNSKEDNFSSDVGEHLFSADTDVKDLIDIDVDGDRDMDVLVAHGNGEIEFLENLGEGRGFRDQGLILSVKNGIRSIAKGDINRDNIEDLVIATVERCRKTDTCIDVYENNRGSFTRKNLQIDQLEKIQIVKTADLNDDGDTDLVTINENGDIKAYYNFDGAFDLSGQLISNMGLTTDPTKNLIPSVLVAYAGMAGFTPGDPSYKTLPFVVPDERTVDVAFRYADTDPSLRSSTKFARDINGGTVISGDRLRYEITLRNESVRTLNTVYVSDVFADGFTLDPASVTCMDCPANTEISLLDIPDPVHKKVFTGFSIPVRTSRTIAYEGTYSAPQETSMEYVLAISSNLSDEIPVRDEYPDLMVTVKGNPTGKVRYFYSTGIAENRRARYSTMLVGEAVDTPATAEEAMDRARRDLERNQSPEALENAKRQAQDLLASQTNDDPDGDGIPQMIDELEGGLDTTADIVSGAMSLLKCSTGCIALPLNYAFLAPGAPSLLGIPVGFDPGLPALDVGPPPPWVGAFGGGLPAAASTFRLYVSPTLTGGIGFGICLGPWLVGQCFNFAIDPLSLIAAAGGPDACKAINSGITGVLSKANDVISSANQGTVLNLGGQNAGGSANPRESGGLINYQLGSYEAPVSPSRNIMVPGFPSVFTEWFRAQINEITSKLFDFPDLYVIYPDVSSLYGAFVPQATDLKIKSLADILTWLNSIPLIDIETETITFKIPWINEKEFKRVQSDWTQWISDLQNEWEKLKQFWQCGTLQETLKQCTFVQAQMNDLIKSVNDNIRNMEEYLLLPKRILDYANIEERYIAQLIDYLDTITRWTGGWVQKNKGRIKQWRKLERDIRNLVSSWEPIFKVALEYMESCDKCKSERFTLMELVMKLFVVVPSPPVIPFPKMPDLVVDVSKIQAGVRVLWPDVQFKPEPLVIPKLPRIKLPIPEVGDFGQLDPNAGFKIVFPKLQVIPPPPQLPRLPTPPSLLELKLPNLPDIPPPPKIPSIPSELRVTLNLFKKIVKIVCLVKTGLLPVPEYNLKPQLEAQTARGLSPLLPIDTLFTVQSPSMNVEYVDRIEVTAYSNFQADFTGLKEGVASVSETANKFSSNFADEINKAFKNLSRTIEGALSPNVEFPGQGFDVDPNRLDRIPELRINKVDEDIEDLKNFMQAWVDFAPDFTRIAREYEKAAKEMPQEIRVQGTESPWIPSGRSLQEIAASIGPEYLETEFEKSLATARDALLSYASSRKVAFGLIQENNFGGAVEKLASLHFPFEGGLKKRLFASAKGSEAPLVNKNNISHKIRIGEISEMENVEEKESLQSFDRRLLALAPGEEPEGGPDDGNINHVGMFVINPETGAGERILNYTFESDSETAQLFIDFDRDGDQDLVYSQSRNVYLKLFGEKRDDEDGYHFSASDVGIMRLSSLIPKMPALNGLSQANSTPSSSLITFLPDKNAFGYEIRASRSGETRITDLLTEQIQNGAIVRLGRSSGPARALTSTRHVVSGNAKNVLVKTGEILHALRDDTEITIVGGYGEPVTMTLDSFDTVPITDQFGGRIALSVDGGSVEIIGTEKTEMILQPGMLLNPEEEIKSVSSSLEILFSTGGRKIVPALSIYSFAILNNPGNPNYTIPLPEGHFTATVTAFDRNGNFGTRGEKILLNPQVCGDDTPPFADAGKEHFTVPLLKTLEIDPTKSFDPGGEIARYSLDMTPEEEGGEIVKTPENPKFLLGPFEQVGTFPGKLTVFDRAENTAYLDIEIEVIAPIITIEERELANGKVIGTVTPPEENVPISISRLRNGFWEILRTPAADSVGRYFTDPSGRFNILDLDLRDRLIVKDHDGIVVAEVNRDTGRVIMTDERYHLEAFPASPPNLPTRIGIVDSEGMVLSYVFFVPDVNSDVHLDSQDTSYTRASGVHVKPFLENDTDFSFAVLPGSSAENPGAALLTRNNETIAMVDVNGDILFFDENLRLRIKNGDFEDPVVFELFYGDQKLAEIFIAIRLGDRKIEIVDEGEIGPVQKPVPPVYPFIDVSPDSPLRGVLKGLYDRGIIQGYENARGELSYRPNQNISRAEYTKITLGMLCIVPRESAKIAPPVFSDIPATLAQWYYPFTKEANLQGFIFGYQAECSSENFCPFKPQNNINRAEAVKIILEALEKLNAIDLSSINKNVDPWYAPYIKVSQDLRPYLKDQEEIAGYILLTPQEAKDPTKQISRGEFAVMADRVLKIRDCYADLNPDPDEDGVSTPQENRYGTDPYDPDTDHGGIRDGVEISRGSDPLDFRDDNPLEVEEGLFITKPTCAQCPCKAEVTFGQDLMDGDTIFGAILKTNPDGSQEMLVRSKELTY